MDNKVKPCKLFVGNLSFKFSEPQLQALFARYGTVLSCAIPTDRDTGRKRGFAFVEMSTQKEAEAAIKGLNGEDVDGRKISVVVSQPRPMQPKEHKSYKASNASEMPAQKALAKQSAAAAPKARPAEVTPILTSQRARDNNPTVAPSTEKNQANTGSENTSVQNLVEPWDELECPVDEHPNRSNLWEANLALRKLRGLKEDPDLKGVFVKHIDLYEKELRRLASFLQNRDHQIAFIGSIGVGKSTGICKLTGLLKPDEERLDRQIVLETGAGGITICEVRISQGSKYGLRIVPRKQESIRVDVEDFSEYLIKTVHADGTSAKPLNDEDGDSLGISKEVVRAIRNMSELTEKRQEEGGKTIRIDPAKELARQFPNKDQLAIQILTRMTLLQRTQTEAWYPDDCAQAPTHWLQQLFLDVNNGRHSQFTLPDLIEVIVPYSVFASKDLSITIVDTKGIDQTAERQDIECHFDDPRSMVVLCSRFNDAPEISVQTLLKRAKEAGIRDIETKTIVMVLPRTDEALAVKHDDGATVESHTEGYDLKKDQIEMRLKLMGFDDLAVIFFNAKDESPDTTQQQLVGKIVRYREEYCKQIRSVSRAIDGLIENRKDEQIRLVFEDINRHLNNWIKNNRQIDWSDFAIQRVLISAINATRYAATIRASVRRHGEWPELDYFYHLSVGTRLVAVSQIKEKVKDFKVITKNLLSDSEFSAGKEFLLRLLERFDASVDSAYQRMQSKGRDAFRHDLDRDLNYWSLCERRWGGGPGYRDTISQLTDDQFKSGYKSTHECVKNRINDEWSGIVLILESMLSEQTSAK